MIESEPGLIRFFWIMRKIGNLLNFIFVFLTIYSCRNKEILLEVQIRKLDYPSASAIEYFDEKLYVIGDDATIVLVMDTSLNIIDSIPLLYYPGKRIPKDSGCR